MEYLDLQKRYLDRGLNDYTLKSAEDFEAVFNLKIDDIKGCEELSSEQKGTFNQFLINYLNGIGLNSKASFSPKSIHYVEEICLGGKETEEEEYFTEYSRQFYIILPAGKKEKMKGKGYTDKDIDYKIVREYKKQFMRFDFKENKKNWWLHVIDEKTWY